MDLGRVRIGEWVAGISGAALLAAMFLRWYGAGEAGLGSPEGDGGGWTSFGPLNEASGVTAWEAFAAVDLVLAAAALLGVAVLVVTATQRTGAIPIATAALTALFATTAVLLVLLRVADPPNANGADLERSMGLFVGLVAAIGTALGAWVSMRDDRVDRSSVALSAASEAVPVRAVPSPARAPETGDAAPSGEDRAGGEG